MRKRLFDATENYTDEALQLDKAVAVRMDEILRAFQGFSYRDMEAVILSAVNLSMAEARIKSRLAEKKAEKEKR